MVNVTIAIVGLAFIAAAIVLLAHHWYKHGPDGDNPLEYPDRLFQESDVCNFHSCSHEMWIMGFILVAAVLTPIAFLT